MENTTPIECEYFYYYVPDYNSSPASCINEFKDLADLIDYIDIYITPPLPPLIVISGVLP